ncbi:MAG: 4-hydroxybenzoate octaprenyltransferase [Magnetococcales bacterium]|nr:4-hydroxybenzoate octaprenyltransferase [Magnetococcales bacterium]
MGKSFPVALIDLLPWPQGRELLRLMRVDRPIGTWLLLWPSLWALSAASPGPPDLVLVAIFVAGAFVMRSAGCVANDLADRDFDPQVARTRERPLAARRVRPGAALLLLGGLLLLALALAWQLNALAWRMSFGGAFLALTYPFTKRIIHLPQFYMGAAFGWGVIIGWAAVAGTIPVEAWLLFAATLTWAAGYDTIYGMMDREDDLRIGVKSTAILFGRYDRLAVAILYLITLALLHAVGLRLGLGWPYLLALGLSLIAMGWQLWCIRGYPSEALLAAFLSNRWVGLILGIGFVAGEWAKPPIF